MTTRRGSRPSPPSPEGSAAAAVPQPQFTFTAGRSTAATNGHGPFCRSRKQSLISTPLTGMIATPSLLCCDTNVLFGGCMVAKFCAEATEAAGLPEADGSAEGARAVLHMLQQLGEAYGLLCSYRCRVRCPALEL